MKKILGSLALISLICVSHGAIAQVYGGFIAGISESEDVSDEDALVEVDTATGYRVGIGNALSEKLAFEFAYVDLGEYDVASLTGDPDPLEASDTLSFSGAEIAVIGKMPVRRQFALFARVALLVWQGERVIEPVVISPESAVVDVSLDGVDYSAGVGVEYRFFRYMGATLEANLYQTDEVSHTLMGAGLYFSF